jgi:hypothetical protein
MVRRRTGAGNQPGHARAALPRRPSQLTLRQLCRAGRARNAHAATWLKQGNRGEARASKAEAAAGTIREAIAVLHAAYRHIAACSMSTKKSDRMHMRRARLRHSRAARVASLDPVHRAVSACRCIEYA